jgi:hypothetical protein
MKKTFTTLAAVIFLCGGALANPPEIIRHTFNWSSEPATILIGDESYEVWKFDGAFIGDEHPSLPFFIRQFAVDEYGRLQVEVLSARYERFDRTPSPDDEILSGELVFQTSVHKEHRRYFGHLAFVPIIRNGNAYERLVEVELRVSLIPDQITFRDPDNVENSVLSDGEIYKIAVTGSGIHKITYNFLKNDLGINIDQVAPRNIKLYGNGGGILPYNLASERIDDLAENHIQIVGGDDGKFDAGDFILFHAEGPDKWFFDQTQGEFSMQKNIYDTKNYYFIKISPGDGLRIESRNSLPGGAYTTNTFDDYARMEEDKRNVLHDWAKAEGSGQKWYGDHFKVAREYSYKTFFDFPNLIPEAPVRVRASMILRAEDSSRFFIRVNGQQLFSDYAQRVSVLSGTNDNIIEYARPANLAGSLSLNSGIIDLAVNYPHPRPGDQSEGWLDFVQFNVRRQLIMDDLQMTFRDVETIGTGSATFQLGFASVNTEVWDITDPLRPIHQETTLTGSTVNFSVNTDVLREFIAFDRTGALHVPQAVGRIDNQNIHAIDQVDMAVIYHPEFESEAVRLADHRNNYSDLNVALVRIDQLFNEFSSGKTDPTAIRDFARMLYNRTERFRYLLIFGDGSFDTRDIYGLGGDFIPVYERESLNPIFSFPADDYFGILEPSTNPSSDPLDGFLSISVGRLPVKTVSEAQAVVNKIINYDVSPDAFGDWRNRLVFVGDDEDSNIHTRDADNIANLLQGLYPNLNIDKIFLDAYPQVSTPGGDRYPAVNEAINKAMFKGVLAMTYLGHGGPKGWAQERVLNVSEIVGWENHDRLPLFITATCSFAAYDDPSYVTAGEEVLLNPRGGAIALMTTTRAVYASQNADLTEAAMKKLFERPDNRIPTLGEMMKNAKNSFTTGTITTNSRKFTLIGDPAQVLAIPEFGVQTLKINDHEVADGGLDTLKALKRVTIQGIIVGADGQKMESFNGEIFPTVFDKRTTVSTLGQDRTSPVREFTVQKNVIFKGRASVTNGQFQFTFVVPKDINYQYGLGKVSYYAFDKNNMIDAAGHYDRAVIGGTDPNALADDQGPLVEVFMNTEDFVFGGITNANPTLLVRLEDDNGINVVGNSIGHDLEGTLDGDTQNTLLLNDFYESELDDYTKGKVRFPLSSLKEGRHTIRVKAWDVANNSAEGYTEFVVAPSGKVALQHVLNYPNPFSDRTCFQFDHNMPNQELEVLIQIFTISGRLVKTIDQVIFSDGAIRRDDCIEWDGRDDYGDQLARGVYLYRVKVRASSTGLSSLNGESDFEKLVILK